MKPKLKPLGTKRLKLKHYEPPSNFDFKFNLRRYTMAVMLVCTYGAATAVFIGGALKWTGVPAFAAHPAGIHWVLPVLAFSITLGLGKAVQLDPIKPTLELESASRAKPLRPKHDKVLSSFAFNFKLRRDRWGWTTTSS
jgi:hypothetical protein